jgi:HlyD family secretion protein
MIHFSPPPRVASAALPFQSDLDRLIAQPTPPFVRFWPAMGFGLLAALALAGALLPIDIVVTAQGRIATDAPPILLRPNARAALTELLVKPGDVVQKGQILARLDATLPQADLAALTAEQRSLTAEIARIRAELSGQTMPASSPEFAAQHSILARRTAEMQASLAAFDAAIAALQTQVQARLRG